MRSWQQREAVAEGLAEWQANPYFAAGRVTVPALLDTFACQSFFNEVSYAPGCAAVLLKAAASSTMRTVPLLQAGWAAAAQPPSQAASPAWLAPLTLYRWKAELIPSFFPWFCACTCRAC
jgi:hypothetical protein